MGFYGNIFNKLQNTFNKIIVNSQPIEATTPEDSIVLKGSNGINISISGNEITFDGQGTTSERLSVEYDKDTKTLTFK